MSDSRSVTRPWWERTSARAPRSDVPGPNWAITSTLRSGCFFATSVRREWADGAAWAADVPAPSGTAAASKTAMVRPRQRRSVELNIRRTPDVPHFGKAKLQMQLAGSSIGGGRSGHERSLRLAPRAGDPAGWTER